MLFRAPCPPAARCRRASPAAKRERWPCGGRVVHRNIYAGFLQSNHSIVHDRQRIFRTRIVGSEHDEVAALPRRLAHQRTLGAIAIAAAAEKCDDLAFQVQLLSHKIARQHGKVAKRVVSVRIVHHHREGLAAIHALKAAGNAAEIEDSFCDRLDRTIARIRGSRCCEHIVDIHIADQRRPHGEFPAGVTI